MSNCSNSGAIMGSDEMGGTVGRCYRANITQCCNDGTVSSNRGGNLGNGCGGIVGWISVKNNTVKDCFNKGIVSGGKNPADIVGHAYADSSGTKFTIENCYTLNSLLKIFYDEAYYATVLLKNNYILDEYLTLEEMKDKEYFVGFDFDNVWDMNENVNEGLPYLSCLYNETPNDYTVNSLILVNNTGKEVTDISENCSAKIRVTKNSIKNNADTIILAMYDNDNKFLGFTHMIIDMNKGQEITLSLPISKANTKKIKFFIWDNISTMSPLSDAYTYESGSIQLCT